MQLWSIWLAVVNLFRDAFSRERAFHWMVLVLIGFTIKSDSLGVTSLARGVGLLPDYYTCMLQFFISEAVDLNKLCQLWVVFVLEKFTSAVKINERHVIIGDGIKIGKEGKKMPGVKSLHQESQSNSKAEYIMGHSIQVVGLLVGVLGSYFSVPLTGQIHEGCRFNCKDKRTQLDKMFEMLISLGINKLYYFVADRYYCSGRLLKQLISKNIHLVSRMKGRAVGFLLPEEVIKKRGRPRKYGEKIKLYDKFNEQSEFIDAAYPGDEKIHIKYRFLDLLWRPLGSLVRFVFVIHPTKGMGIFMCTDLTLSAIDIIKLYSFRFKIEVMFKQAVHQIGAFMYRFWLKCMRPTKRGTGDFLLHFAKPEFKLKVSQKLHAYHLFIQLGLMAQGLMQYMSLYFPALVWGHFSSWLRTIRAGVPPSEKVVSMAMSDVYGEFIVYGHIVGNLKKFIVRRLDLSQIKGQSLGARMAA